MSDEDRQKTENMKEKLEKGMLSDEDLEEQVSSDAR